MPGPAFLARVLVCVAIPASAVFAADADQPAKARSLITHEMQVNGHTFTLPDGFTIELAAGADVVQRPITCDFDELGRLYVSDSSGTNDPSAKQLETRPHRILRLEDTNGDGRFEKRTVFADKMMFPEGTMWLDGSLYVAAPPSIWKLTDTDDDGVADKREEWFQGKTLTGCANDLHGPYRGPDGWIYWCKGAFAEQTYEINGKPWKTKASHIFRCRPDGTGLEPVMTGGMDNPVDVVFTATGDRIFSTTFLQHPAGGLRDGLIHGIYGGVYGKDHAPVHEHPRTSPSLMPVLVHMGPAAPCGLAIYESPAWGTEYVGNLFAAQFNLRKVSRHILRPQGATYESVNEDFIVSDQVDFHPTDVLEDADGSLLIVDTGGWYKLCCPTSQFPKPDVLGGIYRVRKTDAKYIADPRGLKINWKKIHISQVVKLFGDVSPAVRRRAIDEAARCGWDESKEALRNVSAKSPLERMNAVWTAARFEHPGARTLIRTLAKDEDRFVRQAAAHAIGLSRDKHAINEMLTMLARPDAADRRYAAEALGRIGDPAVVDRLLSAAKDATSREVEHSLIYALMEIADLEKTGAGLASANADVRRVALIALDQMPGKNLKADEVVTEFSSDNHQLREAALWIAERHPEWSGRLIEVYQDLLVDLGLGKRARQDLAQRLAKIAKSPDVQQLLAKTVAEGSFSPRRTALQAMSQAGLKDTPPAWLEAIAGCWQADDVTVQTALQAYRSLPPTQPPHPKIIAGLTRIAESDEANLELRIAAAAALPPQTLAPNDSLFDGLLAQLASEVSVNARTNAAAALPKLRFTGDRLLALAAVLPKLGPLELDRALDVFAQSTEDRVGLAVIDAISRSAGGGLRGETVKTRLAKYGPAVQQAVDQFCRMLDADLEKKKSRLEELAKKVAGGDVRRGQAVFHRTKSACIACHAIGYVGGRIGPDLTKIGGIRTERDLLESIVFPSASIARSYESVSFALDDGRIVQGIVQRETDDAYIVITGPNQEARVAKAGVEAMKPANVSLMPAGLDGQLTEADLADLIAFLKACK